jgi:hypothetical protein
MAERVKAKKERDRLRAQQAARLKGILPPSNEEVDKAHGHELVGDFGSQTPDDSSSRRDLTRTPDSAAGGGSMRLGRSPSFGMLTTPGTNVSLIGTPHLGVTPGVPDHSVGSLLGLHHQLPFGSGANTPGSSGNHAGNKSQNAANNNQVQAELQRLYQQALLATQLSAPNGLPGQNGGWGNPDIGMNHQGGGGSIGGSSGYSNVPTGHNLGGSGSTPPANLPDLIALLTGITTATTAAATTTTAASAIFAQWSAATERVFRSYGPTWRHVQPVLAHAFPRFQCSLVPLGTLDEQQRARLRWTWRPRVSERGWT